MAAYLIADIDIDPASYEHYKRQVASVIERFGGRYLAHGGKHEVLEGDWEPRRLSCWSSRTGAPLKLGMLLLSTHLSGASGNNPRIAAWSSSTACDTSLDER